MADLQTPVVLILFNRPDLTAQVFAAIRAARPARLFLVADGPRPDRDGEDALCQAARAVVADVDWPCEVATDFATANLGCNQRIVTGLDWVFAQVKEAIILEDDVLPDPSFFPYCQELLEHYRHDARVLGIGGYNALGEWDAGDASYVVQRLPAIWGWATWRRAWGHYDFTLARYRDWDVQAQLAAHLPDAEQVAYRWQLYQTLREQSSLSWDMQLSLICCLIGGLWLTPRTNLVANIGFDERATHNKMADDLRSQTRRGSLALPLAHGATPARAIDDRFDRWVFLLQMLNTYRDVTALWTWQRALAQRPGLAIPGVANGGRSFVAPLRNPAELLQVLDHLAQYADDHPRLERMRAALRRLNLAA